MRSIPALLAAHLGLAAWRLWTLGVPPLPLPHAAKRLLFSRDWTFAPAFHPPGSENPPLGFWALGFWYRLFPDTLPWFEVALSLAASAVSLWLVVDLTRRLAENETAAVCAGVLLLLHPLFVTWSPTAGTFEPLFLCAALAAANAAARGALYPAAAALLVASGLRYEGWFLAGGFAAWVLVRRGRARRDLGAVALAGAFIGLELLAWKLEGRSLLGMQAASSTVAPGRSNLPEFLLFLLLASPLRNLLLLGAAAWSARRHASAAHWMLGAFIVGYAAAAHFVRSHPYEAHTLPPLALAAPFAGLALARLSERLARAARAPVAAAALALLAVTAAPRKPPVWPSAEDVDLARDLRRHRRKVLLEISEAGEERTARVYSYLTVQALLRRAETVPGVAPAYLDEDCAVGDQPLPVDSWLERSPAAWRAAGIDVVLVNQECTKRKVQGLLGPGLEHGMHTVFRLE